MNTLLLFLILLGLGRRGTGPAPGSGGGGADQLPGRPPGIPKGNPPGGCRRVYKTEDGFVQALNLLGYSPMPNPFGPDGKLGTGDATPDAEIAAFQLDYNSASRKGVLGPKAGGLVEDGMTGPCTMAGMSHVFDTMSVDQWRALTTKPLVPQAGG